MSEIIKALGIEGNVSEVKRIIGSWDKNDIRHALLVDEIKKALEKENAIKDAEDILFWFNFCSVENPNFYQNVGAGYFNKVLHRKTYDKNDVSVEINTGKLLILLLLDKGNSPTTHFEKIEGFSVNTKVDTFSYVNQISIQYQLMKVLSDNDGRNLSGEGKKDIEKAKKKLLKNIANASNNFLTKAVLPIGWDSLVKEMNQNYGLKTELGLRAKNNEFYGYFKVTVKEEMESLLDKILKGFLVWNQSEIKENIEKVLDEYMLEQSLEESGQLKNPGKMKNKAKF